VLERFARLGKLHLLHEPGLTHDQGVWVTRMARMAAKKFDADWVINNDADQFWLAREGTLREVIGRYADRRREPCRSPFRPAPAAAPQPLFFDACRSPRRRQDRVWARTADQCLPSRVSTISMFRTAITS
jgi:hypothetical protein